MYRYAANTVVSVERSKEQIRKVLIAHGASGYGAFEEEGRGILMFRTNDRNYKIRFKLPLVSEFAKTPAGRRKRSMVDQVKHHEQACREFWRAVALIVKANFEAVRIGAMSTEQAFGSMMLIKNGMTAGELIEQAAVTGKMPAALPFLEVS